MKRALPSTLSLIAALVLVGGHPIPAQSFISEETRRAHTARVSGALDELATVPVLVWVKRGVNPTCIRILPRQAEVLQVIHLGDIQGSVQALNRF